MTFGEKLKKLRIDKKLTQDELAEILYVSRTAVSKWESGRGFPNIESLKAISKYFSITVDDLLSGEELITLAEQEQGQKEMHIKDMIFGLLDCSMVLLFFLPQSRLTRQPLTAVVSLCHFVTFPSSEGASGANYYADLCILTLVDSPF